MRRELQEIVAELLDALRDAEDRVEQLNTNDQDRFQSEAAEVAESLAGSLEHLQTRTTALGARTVDDPDLARAIADPACRSVFGR